MAPRKSKKSKKRIRDPRLFPSAEAFQEAGNGDWSVPTGNLDDRNTSWGVAIEPEACAESPRDNWDGPSIPKSKREIEREERQEMDMRLKGWPWADGSREPVSIGPYCLNDYAHHNVLALHPQVQTASKLMRVMNVQGVCEMIIDLLFQHHSSIWKFAFTCQQALHVVSSVVRVWDMTNLNFNGCEIDPTLQARGSAGTVGSNLVVAYLRGPQRRLMEKTLYEGQVFATYQLCHTVKWRGHNFRRLHLHRVPFLTVELLQLVIPHMTNLEMLGVYKCPLIHVGHAMKLLQIITLDRMKGRECQVSLDFYPRLHIGPVIEAGNKCTVGGFGVTWENWQGPTDRAIWAIVFRFVVQCKIQGIDVLSPHTQFRKWLEDGPCYDVENTLAAMTAAFNFDHIQSGQQHGVYKIRRRRRHHADRRRIQEHELFDLYPDLTLAIIAIDQRNLDHRGNIKDFFPSTPFERPEGVGWMYIPYQCTTCSTSMPGVFFHYPDIKLYNDTTDFGSDPNKLYDLPCLGCRLTDSLNAESDHYKQQKLQIMEAWTSDHFNPDHENIPNTTDLGKFLDVFGTRKIMHMAMDLDDIRQRHIQQRGYDRETAELQAPVSDQVERSKRGAFLGAPMIGDWENVLAQREIIQRDPSKAVYLKVGKPRYFLQSRHYG